MTAFNLASVDFDWLPILPLSVLAVGAIAVLLAGVRVDDEDSAGLGVLALIAVLIGAVVAVFTLGQNHSAFSGSLLADDYAAFFDLLLLVSTAVVVAMSLQYAADHGLSGAEYYGLILFSAFGMLLMASAGDLITIFLGLETMSIAVYALAGLMRSDARSSEAAMKYFLLGAFSTGFFLYGIALIYGATGTIRLEAIRAAVASGAPHGVYLPLGMGLMLVGFCFKIAAVPFHMWTPDAYEGAPAPITGFMAVGVKLAAFAAFIRIFMIHLGPVSVRWTGVLWVIAVLTMTVGNVVAVVQSDIKRMLAYSAIAHAGYLIVGMAAAPTHAVGGALLYYLLAYAFTNLGAFAVVVALARRGEPREQISDYRGLARRYPGLAAAMTLFMLSLAGVPPLAGFVAKFYVFAAAIDAGLVWLVVIAVLNSAISAYYYVGVIVAMYMQEGGIEVEPLIARPGLLISIAVSAIAVIVIGLFPQPYMSAATAAYSAALGRSTPQIATNVLAH